MFNTSHLDSISPVSKQLDMDRRLAARDLFRKGDVYAGGEELKLMDAFSMAYCMLVEGGARNMAELKGVGLREFVEEWVERRLCESESGWPVDGHSSRLALEILCRMLNEGVWISFLSVTLVGCLVNATLIDPAS